MDILGIVIQLIAGALGGNAAGSAMKDKSLGTAGNSIAGAVGGLVLAQLVHYFTGVSVSPEAAATAISSLDIGKLIQDVIGGGVGGAILTAIVGAIKNR
jgi:uncharacterized membrane protein YeaQ/YmgE (transglycosylase-associated protein family)